MSLSRFFCCYKRKKISPLSIKTKGAKRNSIDHIEDIHISENDDDSMVTRYYIFTDSRAAQAKQFNLNDIFDDMNKLFYGMSNEHKRVVGIASYGVTREQLYQSVHDANAYYQELGPHTIYLKFSIPYIMTQSEIIPLDFKDLVGLIGQNGQLLRHNNTIITGSMLQNLLDQRTNPEHGSIDTTASSSPAISP